MLVHFWSSLLSVNIYVYVHVSPQLADLSNFLPISLDYIHRKFCSCSREIRPILSRKLQFRRVLFDGGRRENYDNLRSISSDAFEIHRTNFCLGRINLRDFTIIASMYRTWLIQGRLYYIRLLQNAHYQIYHLITPYVISIYAKCILLFLTTCSCILSETMKSLLTILLERIQKLSE